MILNLSLSSLNKRATAVVLSSTHLGYSVPPALHRTIWCRSTFGHVAQAWAIPPPSWGLLSRWHRQETTTPETNGASLPEPSNILKRFCALYDVEIRYYKKKVSKLYCLFNRNPPSVPIWEHSIPAEITKLRGGLRLKIGIIIDFKSSKCWIKMILISNSSKRYRRFKNKLGCNLHIYIRTNNYFNTLVFEMFLQLFVAIDCSVLSRLFVHRCPIQSFLRNL